MSICCICLRASGSAQSSSAARSLSTFSPRRSVYTDASPSFAVRLHPELCLNDKICTDAYGALRQKLGLPPLLLQALRVAFPHIQAATPCQAALLQALVPVQSKRLSLRGAQGSADSEASASGRSLILRDVTGSGKWVRLHISCPHFVAPLTLAVRCLLRSLALLLGMLARSHLGQEQFAKARSSSRARNVKLEQLLLVPHTEIARQMEYWIELLRAAVARPAQTTQGQLTSDSADTARASVAMTSDTRPAEGDTPFSGAQVIYRGLVESLAIEPSTNLLIATPSALLEVLASLRSEDICTIALDEADNMLKLPNRFSTHKEIEKWERHPPALMGIMEELLALPAKPKPKPSLPSRRASNLRKGDRASSRGQGVLSDQPDDDSEAPGKRIIAVSATANSVFRDWMVRRSGWMKLKGDLGERQVDWYDFSTAEESDAQIASGGRDQLSVYQRAGQTLLPKAEVQHLLYRVSSKGDLVADAEISDASAGEASLASASAGRGTPPNLEPFFLAASTLFAVEQITSALMLIPSGTSLPKTLDYLHSLDIPATTLAEARRLNLPADEPRLYMVAAEAVRGLDISQLSHIFILPGTVQDSAAYLHTSGRVGRLVGGDGKRLAGKVVSLVSAQTASAVTQREETRIRRFWELLGIEGRLGEVPELG